MARVYWVTESEVFLAAETGARVEADAGSPAPPSAALADTMRIRLITGDPLCSALIYAPLLPDTAPDGVCCTTGDGVYHLMRDGAWRNVTLQFQDAQTYNYMLTTENIWKAARALIKALLIRMNPRKSIFSHELQI